MHRRTGGIRNRPVNRRLGEQGNDDLRARSEERRDQHDENLAVIRPQVLPDPPERRPRCWLRRAIPRAPPRNLPGGTTCRLPSQCPGWWRGRWGWKRLLIFSDADGSFSIRGSHLPDASWASVNCHFVFWSQVGGVPSGLSGNLARRADSGRGAAAWFREVPMERGNSWDKPVQLAAPVLADAETEAPASYYAGIRAVIEITAQFTPDSWNAPTPCT